LSDDLKFSLSLSEVYGTCGNFFVVEKLQPLAFPSVLEGNVAFLDWVDRAKIATKILDLVSFEINCDI
jgi:hypothetical protein